MTATGKPRVLLTANYGPNELILGEDPYNLTTTRWTRDHGPFSLDMYGHYFALYLIAENITCPTTVLESPHWEDFDRELDQGYDYVGFELFSIHAAKIARMMKRVREKSPHTKIFVGGYGVASLFHPLPGDKNGDAAYIRENADYICREEGVRFVRRLLGDEPVEREITQLHVPTFSLGTFLGIPGVHLRIPTVLVSLGCPNGCDFCNTSAFFKQQKIYISDPEQTFRWIKNYQRRLGFKQIIVMLWDEDLFLNPEYVRELGRMLREDRSMWGVKYYAFGSIRALSQYTAEEIRDCGCQMIWVGVESFQLGQGRPDDGYAKRQGSAQKVIADLQAHGVQVTGSLCLGFDFHTPETMKSDIDQFVALKPMFYQISHVLPCPGTALFDRMKEEERLLDTFGMEGIHFWANDLYRFKDITPEKLRELFNYAHERLANVNGPPMLQMLESELDSYQNLKDYKDTFHRSQAARDRLIASGLCTVIEAVKSSHPSAAVRERARMLEERYKREIGDTTTLNQAISEFIAGNYAERVKAPRGPVVSDPPPRWTYYNTFDDQVHVRKGAASKSPKPYKDTGFISGKQIPEVVKFVTERVKSIDLVKDL